MNGPQVAGLLYFVAAILAALRALRPLVENIRISLLFAELQVH